MTPRAAWRLERLGFTEVYDYVAGKADWLAAGLPTVGTSAPRTRAIDVVDRSVPTCAPDERVTVAASRARRLGWSSCVVVNDHRIVLGRMRLDRVDATSEQPVEEEMEPGPATIRADADVDRTTERLRSRGVGEILVTTPDGELLGGLHAGPA